MAELIRTLQSPAAAGHYGGALTAGPRAQRQGVADDLIELTSLYLGLLDRHDDPCVELRTSYPGRVTNEDDMHLVVVPFRYPEDCHSAPPHRAGHSAIRLLSRAAKSKRRRRRSRSTSAYRRQEASSA